MNQQQEGPGVIKEGWSYTKFVRDNPTAAHTLATLLRYSGFFAPTRFADRDLAIETGYALSSLATLAHHRILLDQSASLRHRGNGWREATIGSADHGQLQGSGIGLDSKRRDGQSSKTALAERMRMVLAIVAHLQVVVEKLARQHGGPRRRRQAITYLESLKALSRLLLLVCTREMIIGGGAYAPGANSRSPPRRDRNKVGGRNNSGAGRGPWREVDLGGVRLDHPQPPRRPQEVYTGKRSGVKLIVPPRASVTWTGRGRSNRSIGGAGRAGTASCYSSSPYSSWDGDSSSYSQPKSVNEELFRGACQARNDNNDSRSSVCANGVGQKTSARGRNRPLSSVGEGWRSDRPEHEGVGGGELSQAWLLAGEVIHILRPLVYSYSCGSAGERSWRPWLTSLGMDAVACACTARAGGGGSRLLLAAVGDGNGVPVLPHLDEEQAAELSRRKLLWFLYLMRSPAFELLVDPVSRGVAGVFDGVPLLGGMASYALSMLLYVQQHHFYISAS